VKSPEPNWCARTALAFFQQHSECNHFFARIRAGYLIKELSVDLKGMLGILHHGEVHALLKQRGFPVPLKASKPSMAEIM